jgi:hypothetical protein
MAKAIRSKKTRFVPRAIFRAAVTGVGVVPVCVGAGVAYLGVGCVAEQCFCDGGAVSPTGSCCEPIVNHDAGDAHVARDAPGVSDAADGAAD